MIAEEWGRVELQQSIHSSLIRIASSFRVGRYFFVVSPRLL